MRLVPRPAPEIEALEALVRSAVGFDDARGDTVTVQSMAFDEAAIADVTEPGLLERLDLDLGQLARTMVLGVVALVIAFGLVRPALRSAAEARGKPDFDPAFGLMSEPDAPYRRRHP